MPNTVATLNGPFRTKYSGYPEQVLSVQIALETSNVLEFVVSLAHLRE